MGGPERRSEQAGNSLKEQLRNTAFTDLCPGSVVRVVDGKLSFPHNLLKRTIHNERVAIVVSNDQICSSPHEPVVVVVPLTHSNNIQQACDVLIQRSRENGLTSDSLAQLWLIQPILKKNINDKIGMLNAHDWDNLLEHFVWMTDRA